MNAPDEAAEVAGNETISSITFTFFDADPITINASHFGIENGWVTAKDADSMPIASFPEALVASIRTRATEHPRSISARSEAPSEVQLLRQIALSLLVAALACGWFFLTSGFDSLPIIMGASLLVGALIALLLSVIMHARHHVPHGWRSSEVSAGTTRRAVRVDDDLWHAALVVAARRGEKLSDIIRAALRAYIDAWGVK